jgi:hypothetical protein
MSIINKIDMFLNENNDVIQQKQKSLGLKHIAYNYYENILDKKHYILKNGDFERVNTQHNDVIKNINSYPEHIQKEIIKFDPYSIKNIKTPSEDVCRYAVSVDGKSIKYIKNPSEEVQKMAIDDSGKAILYIKNATKNIQDYAKKVGEEKSKSGFSNNVAYNSNSVSKGYSKLDKK